MISCASHKTDRELNAEFQINSGKVFDALALVTRQGAAWTYIKPFTKKCHGRGVGRSDTNEGRMLKESHTYEKHPT
jgi:hypothetical protein